MATKRDKEFYLGMAVILGWLARDRREDALVEFAMHDNGIELTHLRAAGVESFDLIPIMKCLPRKSR